LKGPSSDDDRARLDTLVPPATRSGAPESGATATARRRFVLDVVDGDDHGRRVVQERLPLTVGTAQGDDLQLTDRYASRHHCRIIQSEDGSYLLHDQGSRNGTYCNGIRVFQIAIALGTEVQVGRTRIRFGLEDPDAEAKVDSFGELLGGGHAMRRVFDVLRSVTASELTCLILGETGTGKELAARALHDNSCRAGGPFIVIDCGTVSESLIEDKLFGHERGAFTGALKDAKGAFEEAHRGTIFLDEVGELQLGLQPKLLRVLERREVTRLGSHRPLHVDVRVVAATHRNLESMVASGGFREDLYYRLTEATITLPPLRNRTEDIELLARAVLDQIGGRQLSLTADALELLAGYSWPGNVRELRNVLRRLAATARGNVLDAAALQGMAWQKPRPSERTREQRPELYSTLPLAAAKDAQRKEYLAQLLGVHGDDHDAIARQMGVNIKYARRLLRRYGLIA
jgi:DNA-binding NtrC family response regulator